MFRFPVSRSLEMRQAFNLNPFIPFRSQEWQNFRRKFKFMQLVWRWDIRSASSTSSANLLAQISEGVKGHVQNLMIYFEVWHVESILRGTDSVSRSARCMFPGEAWSMPPRPSCWDGCTASPRWTALQKGLQRLILKSCFPSFFKPQFLDMCSWFSIVDYIWLHILWYYYTYITHISSHHGFMASKYVSQDSIGCLIIDEVHERDVANPVLLSARQKKTQIWSKNWKTLPPVWFKLLQSRDLSTCRLVPGSSCLTISPISPFRSFRSEVYTDFLLLLLKEAMLNGHMPHLKAGADMRIFWAKASQTKSWQNSCDNWSELLAHSKSQGFMLEGKLQEHKHCNYCFKNQTPVRPCTFISFTVTLIYFFPNFI